MPRSFPHRRRSERGSALLLAIVLIVLLGVVGLAVSSRASSETGAVAAKRHHDATVSCADAARDLLMSQFRAYGTSPLDMQLSSTAGDHTLSSGHYDDLNVKSVQAVGSATQATAFGVSDVSNRIARTGLGGQVYRMTVVCSSPSPSGGPARQGEVEYVVRFGL